MAPSTPPPPSKVVLAAFTIASTASLVISPRTSFTRGSAMLRLVNQTNSARVLVSRPRRFHRTRIAIEQKCLHVRMRFTPFSKGAADAASVGDVETGGEFAHVVKNKEAAGSERRVPKIELGERRSIFVGAVHDD